MGSSVPVAASWGIAVDRLIPEHPVGVQLLTLLAWLAPEPVPLTLITEHTTPLPAPLAQVVRDPLALAELTTVLRRRGMAQVTPGTITLHRVPAALLRARAAHDHSHHGGWAALVIRLLGAAVPDDPWNNPPVWPTWRLLLPHVLAATDPARALSEVVAEVSWLLRRAGDYLRSRGEPRAARPLVERAYQLNQDRLDPDDPTLLATSVDLALVLAALGEYERARALDEDTLIRRRRVLGEDHPDTLRSAHNLAHDLAALGEHEQAAQLHEWIALHHSS
jgi:hypothetical protein